MVLGLMKKGDSVLNVTSEFVAIKRKNGDVDIIPMIKRGNHFSIDEDNIVTISYGDNTVSYTTENGVRIEEL